MTDVITFVVMMPIPEFSRFHDNVRESPKFNLYLFKKGKKKLREIPRLPRRLPRDSHSQFFISNFDVAAIPSGILFNNKK